MSTEEAVPRLANVPHARRRALRGLAGLGAAGAGAPFAAGLAASLAGGAPAPASAQSYPARPVKIVVGSAPGGPADFLARLFGDTLGQALGQPFVVENRPGASGVMAAESVAKAPADGYTLTVGGPAAMISPPYLMARVGYDPIRDFAPVAMLGAGAFVLAVHPSVPARSLQDLIALARSKPGSVAFGTGGVGAAAHLITESFAAAAGVKLLHVPYKGEGQAVNDLLGGQLQLMFTAPNVVLPHVRSGRLRALAVSSRDRMASAPEIPTAHEAGLADFEYLGWIVAYAPAAVPRAVTDTLAAAWLKLRGQPAVRDRLETMGMVAPDRFASGDALQAFLKAEDQRTSRLIRALGIQPQ